MSNNNNRWQTILQAKMANPRERGAFKRDWIKLKLSFLTSSINYRMELSEQAVFTKLLLLAEELGPVPGLISDNDCRAVPLSEIASRCHCTVELLQSTIKKAIKDDSIYSSKHGIFLTHFSDYQFSEYDRQKPFRQRKRHRGQDQSPEALAQANKENEDRIRAHEALRKGKK